MCQSSFSTKGKAQGALTLYVPVADVCSCVKQKKITPKEYLFLVTVLSQRRELSQSHRNYFGESTLIAGFSKR